jgi:hypothetical protein
LSAPALEAWHRLVREGDPSGLDGLLADDVVFHSPIVHTPQQGKALATLYLSAAFALLFGESFRYVREVEGPRDAVLEFVAEVDGIHVNGVDMIRWNERGEIVDFKVMIRPLKAIQLLHRRMAERLEQMKGASPSDVERS